MSVIKLFDLEHEKQLLSAIIRNSEILAEIPLINEKDFSPTNRVIFQGIKSCVETDKSVNKFTLISKLNALNIKIANEIEPAIYINSLELIGVNDKAAIEIAKQIKKWTVRRELHAIGEQIKRVTESDSDKKAVELVNEVTKIFNDKLDILSGSSENEPKDLYGSIRSFLDIDNSFTKKAIVPPYKIFSDLWGYWDSGATSVIVSRMKIGKSSFWLSTLYKLSLEDKNDEFRALVFDTELTVEENQSRSLAAVSGVKEFRIKQGYYKQYKNERDKVESAASILEPLEKRVQHCFCGAMELEEMLSIARRWAKRNLTDGKRGIIVFDYLKLNSSADFKSQTPLFVKIGEKINALKNLTKELGVPCLCFAQTNRENVDSKAGDKQQNSSVIGGSDMIAQFASNIYLLEDLSPDERANLNQINPGDGTHSLREIACRQRGPCELGEDGYVQYKDQFGKNKWGKNYLIYNFDSFNVTEVTTFRRLMEKKKIIVDVQKEAPEDNSQEKML